MFSSKKKVNKSADLRLFRNLSWPEKLIVLIGIVFFSHLITILIWWVMGW